jgi:hypothetical protein
MIYIATKAALSGLLAALVSEIARQSPAFGALIASLPLISVMAVIWLWRDTGDNARIASHVEATFWYVIPSRPMFLLVPSDAPRRCRVLACAGGGQLRHLRIVSAHGWVAARFPIQL